MNIFKIINRSVRWQLFFSFTVITVISIIIIGILLYTTVLTMLERKYIEHTEQLTKQITGNLDMNLSELDKIITPVYYVKELRNILKRDNTGEYLKSLQVLTGVFYNSVYSRDNIYELELYDMDGNNILAVNVYRQLNNEKEQEWFKNTLLEKGLRNIFVWHYKDNTTKEQTIVSMSRAIYDLNSMEIAGVIKINENQKEIEKTLLNIKFSYNSAIAVITQQGNVLYCNNPDIIKEINENSILKEKILNSGSVSSFKDKVLGTDFMVTVSESEFSGFKVVLLTPNFEITKDSNRIKYYFIIFIFIYCTIMLIISLSFSYRISKPIIKIRSLMKSVEKEKFDVRAEIKGNNEISQLGLGFNRMVDKINNLVKDKYMMNILKKEAELEVLQNQINPHFLYNTLSSIKGLLQEDLKGSSNKGITVNAVKMIQALSDIFRYNLDMKSHMVTLENEIENIRNYLVLQKFRYEDKIRVMYDIDESILDCNILKMTLQPLVENSIVHGLELKRGVGEIKISIVQCNACVKITVSDNGAGIEDGKINEMNEILCRNEDEQFLQAHKEVGIYNVNARIKYYFGSSYGLKYYGNESGGITAQIILPLRRAL